MAANFIQIGEATPSAYYLGSSPVSAIYIGSTLVWNLSSPAAIAAYSFSEGSGTTSADNTGNGFTAQVDGAWTTGHTGGGVEGVSDTDAFSVTGNMITSPTSFTLMAWCYFTDSGQRDFAAFASDSSLNTAFAGFGWENDGTHLFVWASQTNGSAPDVISTITTSTDTWTHIAIVLTPTTITFYINGVDVVSNTNSYSPSNFYYMILGGIPRWGTGNMGIVDDVRLFNDALTSADITWYMNMPVSGTTPVGGGSSPSSLPAPIAEYSFDEDSGTTAADNTGNGYTLTLNSPGTWSSSGHHNSALNAGSSSTGYGTGGAFNTDFTNPATSITMMGWVNPTATTAGERELFGFFDNTNLDNTMFAVWQTRNSFGTSGVLQLDARIGGLGSANAATALPVGTWAHVAGTYDGTTFTLYVNGTIVAAASASGTLNTGPVFYVGSEADALIDDVRVFDTALTADEITAYMAIPVNWGVVTTLAGAGTTGYVNATGAAAYFDNPTGVAVDTSGNVYVADFNNERIRKITSAGVVTTLAGSGTAGFADATGTAAQFSSPTGIAVDSSGNVYVGDYANHRIRKITSAGVVTTLAGSGTAGFADATGTAAQFNSPHGVAVDSSGNVYVADSNNNRIRKITSAGVVTTLAGSGTAGGNNGTGTAAQFNTPRGVAVDSSGNVYVADSDDNQIRKITSAGVVTTLAGNDTAAFADGSNTSAEFNGPTGVAVDSSGNVYVADLTNNRIRVIIPAGLVMTLAGSSTAGFQNGTGGTAQFNFPYGVAVDASGTVYVAEYNNSAIRKIT